MFGIDLSFKMFKSSITIGYLPNFYSGSIRIILVAVCKIKLEK